MDSRASISESDGRDIGDAIIIIASLGLLLLAQGWGEKALAILLITIVAVQRRSRVVVETRLGSLDSKLCEALLRVDGLAATVSEQWQAVHKEIDSLRSEMRSIQAPVRVAVSPVTFERKEPARYRWRVAAPLVLFFCALNLVLFKALDSRVAVSDDRYERMQVRLSELERSSYDSRLELEAVSQMSRELNDQLSLQIAQTLEASCRTQPVQSIDPFDYDWLSVDFPSAADLSEARAQLIR